MDGAAAIAPAASPTIPGIVRVPWWAQARAERLIERVYSEDMRITPGVLRLTAGVIERSKRKPQAPIRKADIPDLVRGWRTKMDTFSRLGIVEDTGKHGLMISDCRVVSDAFCLSGWPQDRVEEGLALIIARVIVRPFDVRLPVERLAFVSKHALGRRYERGGDTTDETVIGDFQRMMIDHDRLSRCAPFACRVPAGVWAGDPAPHKGQAEPVLEVRTFLGWKELQNG